MAEINIICKPTLDTFVRFGIVLTAFLGFGLYFFYDGFVGYRLANEVYFSYHAFAKLGEEAADTANSAAWKTKRLSTPLIESRTVNNEPAATVEEQVYPLPSDCEAARSCPAEACDYDAMNKSWNDCWLQYSARRHFPAKPADHPYDTAAIREQWYAGGVCVFISALLLAFMIRTSRRVMALQGDTVTAAGQQFNVADITRLDIRQWGKGFKGIAYATVNGRKIRLDGMTYGGFDPRKGEPAEAFMKALQARYQGEILEYEEV